MIRLVIFTLFFLGGCDLFQLRDPEDPAVTRSSFTQPLTPNVVPENLRLAFQEANQSNFYKCLSFEQQLNDYRFIPSPELTDIPQLDISDELTAFSNLQLDLLPGENMTVQWIEPTELLNQIDSAQYKSNYRLLIPRSSTDYPSFIEGSLILSLRKDASGFWEIRRWQDFSNGNDDSWSTLKWRFAR